MRVELGAGERPAPGYLALDLNPRTADLVGDALALPFRTGTVEALRAVDVLEHLSYRDTDRALAEWARVCAPDAPLYVQVPDAHAAIRRYLEWPNDCARRRPGEKGPLGWLEWVLLGGHRDGKYCRTGDDFRWNAHYSLWSSATLHDALDRAGFALIRCPTNDHPNLLCDARRRP